uniref:Cytochrome c oxidase subunit NDUFA4 n=1 Tax=Oreochromis niloticus TaxID=8128 RepID=A0A669CIZ8_ORENI
VLATRFKLVEQWAFSASSVSQGSVVLLTAFLLVFRWDHKNNPEPWNKMEPNQQYKLLAVNMDYSKLKKDRPDF